MVERLRLLVVDDDEVDRAAIRRALAKTGVDAEVSEAADFASARLALLTGSFDCAFLDFRLPGGDGLELLRAAREAEVDSPIIVMTCHGDESLAVDLMRNGAGDYFPKSQLSPERLAQSMSRVLRVRDAERRERAASLALAGQAAQLRVLADVSVRIHGAPSTDGALDALAREAHGLFEAEIVLVILRAPDAAGTPAVRLSLSGLAAGRGTAAIAASVEDAQLFERGKSLRLTEEELATHIEWRALRVLAADPPITLRGLLAARLANRDGSSVGCVLLSDRRGGDFSASDELILLQLAQSASVALENARLYQSAQQATRARDEVLAVVSHDLRNPLHVVSMSAALLRANLSECEPDPSRDLAVIERIERSNGRMRRMIDDILEATRVDGGKLAVSTTHERAASLVREALSSATYLAEQKDVVLRSGPLDESILVMADRGRILQLLSNLLVSSLKWTEHGAAITLSLTRARDEACFAVADEGPGIDAAELPHMFERYWKANDGPRDGAGLGLFIARRIVEAHGGRIAVESERGLGTTVRFWLPVAA